MWPSQVEVHTRILVNSWRNSIDNLWCTNHMRPAPSFTVTYSSHIQKRIIFNGFSNSKIRALSIPHLWRAVTAIQFSLSVHSIVTAETGLDCFGAFLVYISTVSDINITFGWVQFFSHKSHVYTCINIYGSTRYITSLWCAKFILLAFPSIVSFFPRHNPAVLLDLNLLHYVNLNMSGTTLSSSAWLILYHYSLQ